MGVFDLFSKRRRRERGESSDVYIYDSLPYPLRVQIVQVLVDGLPYPGSGGVGPYYELLHDTIARELGVFVLNDENRGRYDTPHKVKDFINHFLKVENAELALDCVELAFQLMSNVHGNEYQLRILQPKVSAVAAIEELNTRFREHGVGYEFDGQSIVRVDSRLLHQHAVKPALALLAARHYEAAEMEFMRAHEHYRHGRFEEAITDALKSMESVLKVICGRRRWPFKETDTAKALLTRNLASPWGST